MGWRYHCGLCLIVVAVFTWVASAEITQRIFLEYEHPFAITYLGIALMVIYLPVAALKDLIHVLGRLGISKWIDTEMCNSPGNDLICNLSMDKNVREEDEAWPLRNIDEYDEPHLLQQGSELHAWDAVKYSLCLAPIWFFTEYLSNLALANTSVASTTILGSTSGLFTLFFGALLGQHSINSLKVFSVFISMAGVSLTTFGKTWAPDQSVNASEEREHTIKGDVYCLLSAMLFGLFTVLLKKSCGPERNKVDVQKFFGYIGLFTLVGFWWLVWPLNFMGLEPEFVLPTPSTGEIVLVNGFIGSFLMDYIWAISVVWTTPLVATLGMTLTVPLAMVADMVIHKCSYSAIYILGCVQVLAGFVLANISDNLALDSNPS